MPKLMMADVDEINAAFDKVFPELMNLAHYYAGMVHVPFVDVDAMVKQQMQTAQFKRAAVQIISDAIEAAEAVRAKKANAAA